MASHRLWPDSFVPRLEYRADEYEREAQKGIRQIEIVPRALHLAPAHDPEDVKCLAAGRDCATTNAAVR